MAEAVKTSSGVENLISRLRDDGVTAGKVEADRILGEARREAADIVAQANAEVTALRESAAEQIARDREAAVQALKLAERDTVLELRERVTQHFKQHMKRLVSTVTKDEDLIKSLVLVLAGHAASDYVRGRDAQILVSAALFNETPDDPADLDGARERSKHLILGITGDMLRDGVELIPATEVNGGARVRAKGEDAEVDLSDAAISELLIRHMTPRFRAILEGSEV